MTNYLPLDFTDIRGPEEKPTVDGFYPSDVVSGHGNCLHRFREHGATEFRNGEWRWVEYDGEPCIVQDRYWFGLKEKP